MFDHKINIEKNAILCVLKGQFDAEEARQYNQKFMEGIDRLELEGGDLEHGHVERLAHEVDTIVALKDAAGDPGETAKVIAAAPDDFAVYSGDDGLTLPLLSVGAVGVIGVATHWAGVPFRAMIEAMHAGDVARARALHQLLLPSFGFESTLSAPNPVPTKAMLRALGQPAGPCRPPLGPCPEGLEAFAKSLFDELRDAEA